MFNIMEHGGDCCGVSHVSDFSTSNDSSIMDKYEKALRVDIADSQQDLIDNYNERREDEEDHHEGDFHHLYEAVLTSYQQTYWHDRLLKMGWTVAAEWSNSNSGNNLKMYTLIT